MIFGRWLLLFAISLNLWASPAEEPKETRIPILDMLDDIVGNDINHVANDFDAFFATERADDELGRSRVRLRDGYRMTERANGDNDLQFRFNMRLPYLEQRFRYELEDKEKEKSSLTEAERKAARQRRAKRSQVDERWLFSGDTSANVSIHPRAIVRGRLRKSKQTGTLIHRFVQEITWATNADGFRQRTTLSTDQKISEEFLFRFNNIVDWRISQKDFTTSHGPGLFQRLSEIEAVSYNVGFGTTVTNGSWYLSGYTVAPTYRRDLYRNMLYMDIVPGIDFPKQWHFRRTPFIFLQLELLFGS